MVTVHPSPPPEPPKENPAFCDCPKGHEGGHEWQRKWNGDIVCFHCEHSLSDQHKRELLDAAREHFHKHGGPYPLSMDWKSIKLSKLR